MSDLVGSTHLVEQLGDSAAAELFLHHDRLARDLMEDHGGKEIDKADGFLLLFELPIHAALYALSYHQVLETLSQTEGVKLTARVGIHLGEVILHENPPQHVARGAKPLEVEGLAKPMAARLMSLAEGRQTLLTRSAFDVARRSTVGAAPSRQGVRWLAHGNYLFKGIEEAVEIFEVGVEGLAPLRPPQASEKAQRVVGQDTILGWRPGPGLAIPKRTHWILERKLGEGGSGEVWLATHEKTSDHRVFKFCFDTTRLQSLEREITLFRLLKEELGERDDITRILDWNFDEAPFFIESEYTAAGSLVDWAEAQGGIGRVPLETRLELVAQVAEALAAAHSVGVLHKDVKPANILISADPQGRPKARLTDFGIGLITDRKRLAGTGITELGMTDTTGSHTGSRLYMAPELLEGKAASVQADIYALGVVLYQMVAGELSHALAPGWKRGIRDEILREDIAIAVDGSPEQRLGNARQFAEMLRTVEERRRQRLEARSAKEDAERQKAAMERARKRRKLAASLIVGLAIFAGAMGFQAYRISLEAARANREAAAARQVSEFLVEFLKIWDPDTGRDVQIKTQELLDRSVQVIEELKDQPLIQAQLMNGVGVVYEKLERFGIAASLLERAVEIRESLLGGEHADLADSLFNLGEVYREQGNYLKSELLLERALAMQQKILGPDHLAVSRTLHALANLHSNQGDYVAAEPLAQRALVIREKLLDSTHPDLAEILNFVGRIYSKRDQYEAAESVLERALEIREEVLGSEHLDVAQTLNELAILNIELGRYSRAEQLQRRSTDILKKILGPDHFDARNLMTRARLLGRLGRYGEAETAYLRALEIDEEHLGPAHPYTANVVHDLADLYAIQRKYAQAEPLYSRALRIREAALKPNNPKLAFTLHRLANLYRDQGRFAEAEPLYHRTLGIWESLEGKPAPAAEALDDYAALLRSTDRQEAAEELEAKALLLRHEMTASE